MIMIIVIIILNVSTDRTAYIYDYKQNIIDIIRPERDGFDLMVI